MGNVYKIARTNDFWVNNLNNFKEGLKGFVGGEFGSEIQYSYSEYKKRSNKALINMSSEDFSVGVWQQDNDDIELDLLDYIQEHIVDGEEVEIHLVEYEHASDMCITKFIITKNDINFVEILE